MKVDVSQFTSLLTWWWLPSFGSQLLLNACYSMQLVTPPAPAAVQRRNNHVQLARTAVIVGTLVYQLVNAAATAQPNYYQLLALPLDVDGEGVRRSFRALARRYHPDKVGEQGEAFFIVLRRAHDALSEPVKRFAYDRFGAEVAEWKDCESARDFMRRGLMSLVGFYTINPAMYALFGYMNGGGASGVSFWRLACLFALLAAELSMLVAPEYPRWLAILLPNMTIYDVRQLAHSLFINFFFASMQLGAALDVLEYGERGAPARSKASRAERAKAELEAVRIKTQTVHQAAELVARTALGNFAREMQPFRPQLEAKVEAREMSGDEAKLFARIDEVLLSRSLLQQHPQLAQALRHAPKQTVRHEPSADEQRTEAIKQEDTPHGTTSFEEPRVEAGSGTAKTSDAADAVSTPAEDDTSVSPSGKDTAKTCIADAADAEADASPPAAPIEGEESEVPAGIGEATTAAESASSEAWTHVDAEAPRAGEAAVEPDEPKAGDASAFDEPSAMSAKVADAAGAALR